MIENISKYRTFLMGVAMLSVFVFHMRGGHWMVPCVYNVVDAGSIGVDVFMFLSAIGLTFSMRRNPQVWAFYKRRAMRIFPAYWLVMTGVYLCVFVVMRKGLIPDDFYPIPKSLWQVVEAYTTIGFWIPGGTYYLWYIPAILVLYLVFPFVFKCFERSRWTYLMVLVPGALQTFCSLTMPGLQEGFLTRIGIFLWGGVFAREFLMKDRRVSPLLVYGVGVASFVAYVVRLEMGIPRFCRFAEEALFCITLPCILASITVFCRSRWIERSVSAVGKVSLEFYLTHEFILRIFGACSHLVVPLTPLQKSILTFCFSMLAAYAVHGMVGWLMGVASRKSNVSKQQ